MAVAERFEISPFSITDQAGTPVTTNFQQVLSVRMRQNAQYTTIRPAGSVEAKSVILASAEPAAEIRTGDLLTFFGVATPASGLCASTATFRLTQREQCATFSSAAEHVTVTTPGGGALIPVSVEVTHDSVEGAVLTAMYYVFWSGNDDPFELTDNVNFSSAPAAAFVSQYYLGGVFHNGTELCGIDYARLDFGIEFDLSPQKAGPFPATGAIVKRDPTFNFRCRKINEATAFDPLQASAVNTSMTFYLQRGSSNSDRVARATTQHTSFAWSAGKISVDEIGGDAGEDAILDVTCHISSAITISQATAIPAIT